MRRQKINAGDIDILGTGFFVGFLLKKVRYLGRQKVLKRRIVVFLLSERLNSPSFRSVTVSLNYIVVCDGRRTASHTLDPVIVSRVELVRVARRFAFADHRIIITSYPSRQLNDLINVFTVSLLKRNLPNVFEGRCGREAQHKL